MWRDGRQSREEARVSDVDKCGEEAKAQDLQEEMRPPMFGDKRLETLWGVVMCVVLCGAAVIALLIVAMIINSVVQCWF